MEQSAAPPGRQGPDWGQLLSKFGSTPLIAKVGVIGGIVLLAAFGYLLLTPSSTGNSVATEDLDVNVIDPAPQVGVSGQAISGEASSREQPEESAASSKLLEAPEVPSCTIFVSNGGNDGASGTVEGEPLASPDAAVQRAAPGDVVCFAPGTYGSTSGNRGALHIEDKNGSPEAPITFRSLDPAARAVFTMGGANDGRSVSVVFIQRSSHLVVENIEATNGFRGFSVNGGNNIKLLGSYIHHTGGEIVYVGKRVGRIEPDAKNNPSSHDVIIEGNEIAFSGQAGDAFGEGVYVATSTASYADDTHNVTIRNNSIHDVKDEAIDVKTGGYAVSIVDNQIHNIELNSQGAITVATHGENWNPGGFVVSGNRISNVSGRGSEAVGIWLGHGDAIIENNVVWNVADWGIYIPNTFNLPDSADVVIRNNTVWATNGRSVEWGRAWSDVPSQPPNVSFDSSNMTWDGTGDSTKLDRCDLCVAG
jgi:hypothetical protein